MLRDGFLFEGLNIFNQNFLCMHWWFSWFFNSFFSFHYLIQLLTFYLLLWNNMLISKMLTETPSLWFVDVLKCRPLIGCRDNAQEFNLSQTASGMILQNHRRLPVSIFSVKIAALGNFKYFQRSKLKLWVWFFSSTKERNINLVAQSL